MKFTKFDAGSWPGVQLDLDPAAAGSAEAPSPSPDTPENPGAVTAPSTEQPEETAAKEIAGEINKEEEAAEPGWKEIEDKLDQKKRRLAEVKNEVSDVEKDTNYLKSRPFAFEDRKLCMKGLVIDILMPQLKGLPIPYVFKIVKQITDFPEIRDFMARSAKSCWEHLDRKCEDSRMRANSVKKEIPE